MTRLAILSPARINPVLEQELDEQRHAFAALGLDYAAPHWTAPDLSGYDLILPLMAWGYHQMPQDWAAALDRWEAARLPFANPVSVLRWNGDKAYLAALAAQGLPVVPTMMTDALTPDDLAVARDSFGTDDLVIKPPVSAGADGTHCLRSGQGAPAEALGERTLIQPMMASIASEGEVSLFYFGGAFSHAILKVPQAGDFRVQFQFGGREHRIAPPAAALATAKAVLASVAEPLLYARVDLVNDGAGRYLLMELELIEPALFLHHAEDGGKAFADAVRGWKGS
jgi:glutathione synthase/RimK-type ligase-like ATP-grasp enzyme